MFRRTGSGPKVRPQGEEALLPIRAKREGKMRQRFW